MSLLDNLSQDQLKKKMKNLDSDLKNNRPTKAQAEYSKFYLENIGYHWKEIFTGKFYSKNQLFFKFYPDMRIITMLAINAHPDYEKKLKDGFVEVYKKGIKIAIRIGTEYE